MSCLGLLGGCTGCKSCTSTPGAAGPDGADGLSAYEMWIAEGNIGDEQAFLDSLVGADGAAGAPGAPGVPNPKINFYSEFVGQVSVSASLPNPAVYEFPVGYGVNTYTNGTGIARDYIVYGSFDTTLAVSNSEDIANWVDGAIIKTVAAVDNVEWEHKGDSDIRVSIYDGAGLLDSVNILTTNKLLSVDTSPVEVRFGSAKLTKNVSFFKKVTLNDTETISLKFKTKDASTPSFLEKAQFFVLEID
jgi:hypothetical protein